MWAIDYNLTNGSSTRTNYFALSMLQLFGTGMELGLISIHLVKGDANKGFMMA